MLGFRVFFTPRQGYFSVFARATCSLSVYQEYLGLERGRPRFTQDFTSLALLRYRLELTSLRVRAYHPLWDRFPASSARVVSPISPALQPRSVNTPVWPLPLSLAATGGISSISVPLATKMFQFTRFASAHKESDTEGSPQWVAPFGHPGITASVQLPQTFRSLARPSSPLIA